MYWFKLDVLKKVSEYKIRAKNSIKLSHIPKSYIVDNMLFSLNIARNQLTKLLAELLIDIKTVFYPNSDLETVRINKTVLV